MPPVERTDATVTVSRPGELFSALSDATAGDVVWVESGASLDVGDSKGVVESGVTLASDGSAHIHASEHVWPRFQVRQGARVSGLRIQGPIPLGNGLIDYGNVALGLNLTGSGAEVDRCELWGWGDAAIYSRNGGQHIHNCDIHHNRQEGIGYGVGVADGGDPLIEYNTFSHNRHDVSSVCDSCSYEVRNNLHQSPRYGTGVDVHEPGGYDFRIHHNEDRVTDEYSVAIRGTPSNVAEIYNNWYYNTAGNVASASSWPDATVLQTQHGSDAFENVNVHDNHYGSTAPPDGIGRADGSEPDGPDGPTDPDSPDTGGENGWDDTVIRLSEDELLAMSSIFLGTVLGRSIRDD